MKAFVVACVVIVVISAIAGFGLEALDMSSGQTYSSDNVRLD
ncbi:MAG: hypothetical protein WD489_04020 [Rhodovibrionaceae bacterium]